MVCLLFSTKPLSKPMMAYPWLDHWEQILVKFQLKYMDKHFETRKCIWKCRLQYGSYFSRRKYINKFKVLAVNVMQGDILKLLTGYMLAFKTVEGVRYYMYVYRSVLVSYKINSGICVRKMCIITICVIIVYVAVNNAHVFNVRLQECCHYIVCVCVIYVINC